MNKITCVHSLTFIFFSDERVPKVMADFIDTRMGILH